MQGRVGLRQLPMSMFSTCRLHLTTGSPMPGTCQRVILFAGWCQPGPAPRLLAWPRWASADAQGCGGGRRWLPSPRLCMGISLRQRAPPRVESSAPKASQPLPHEFLLFRFKVSLKIQPLLLSWHLSLLCVHDGPEEPPFSKA